MSAKKTKDPTLINWPILNFLNLNGMTKSKMVATAILIC